MPKKCTHCEKESFNNYICDHCQIPINQKFNWKENQEIEIEEKKYKIDPAIIISISIMIIALSIAFNSYTEYRQQQEMEKLMGSYVKSLGKVNEIMIDGQEKIKEAFKPLQEYKANQNN